MNRRIRDHQEGIVHLGDQKLLDRPEGGSINEIRFERDSVVKSYSGSLERGYQKLREEYYWLSSLPGHLAQCFTRPVRYLDLADPRLVELHLVREPKIAVAKGVLKGELNESQLEEIVRCVLEFLSKELYPVRTARMNGRSVYERYHRNRLLVATEYLRKHPVFGEPVEAAELVVNGESCPSVARFLDWAEENADRCFSDTRLVAMHGDTHLDNILTDVGWTGSPELTFIDPRGDLTGPAHYDFAKLLKALEGHYDVIHYGMCSVGFRGDDARYELFLDVERSFDGHYARGLAAALDNVEAYADAERVSVPDFMKATLFAECCHVLSFSFYHAYAPEPNHDRVRAYLAVFALMARRLMLADAEHLLETIEKPLLPY